MLGALGSSPQLRIKVGMPMLHYDLSTREVETRRSEVQDYPLFRCIMEHTRQDRKRKRLNMGVMIEPPDKVMKLRDLAQGYEYGSMIRAPA